MNLHTRCYFIIPPHTFPILPCLGSQTYLHCEIQSRQEQEVVSKSHQSSSLCWKYSHWFWSVIQGNHSCWQLVMKSHKFLVYHFPWDLLTPGLSKQLSEYSSPKTHFLVFRASLTWCCFPDFKCWTDDFVLCRSNNSYNLKVQTLKFQYSNIEISKFEIQTLNFQHLKI